MDQTDAIRDAIRAELDARDIRMSIQKSKDEVYGVLIVVFLAVAVVALSVVDWTIEKLTGFSPVRWFSGW